MVGKESILNSYPKGPIILISLEEINVNDPALIKAVYTGGHKKRNRTFEAVTQPLRPQAWSS